LWTPGYWAWSDDYQDYYWVPGTWVLAPQPGYLWTPGYWGVDGAVFLWHPGYWGPQVGYYGGVNYGYGYGSRGYEGGYWQGNRLYYNSTVNNFGTVNVTNVYNKTVINNTTVTRVSYNGGNGTQVQPTPAQLAASREPHIPATAAQQQQIKVAASQPALRAGENQGRPPIAATPRPGAFSGAGVVGARAAGAPNGVHETAPPHENLSQRYPQPSASPPRPPYSVPADREPERVEQYQGRPGAAPPPRPEAPPPRPEAPPPRALPPPRVEAPPARSEAPPPPRAVPPPHPAAPEPHAAPRPEHDPHEN
jgi:hypothetical protein